MAPIQVKYPIIPTEEEARQLEDWCRKVSENVPIAMEVWRNYHNFVTHKTRTGDFFKLWNKPDEVFWPFLRPERRHIIKAVLNVAYRFKWPPNEILALWQIEGLPAYRGLEKDGFSWDPWSIRRYGFSNPHSKEDAVAIARSIILYERWGLDKLTPHTPGVGDNILHGGNRSIHDQKFEEGFILEISPILATSPLEYLSTNMASEEGPIKVERRWQHNNRWFFGTDSSYQTTLLAMQFARFKNLEKVITEHYAREEIELPRCRGKKVKLDLSFPAFVRTFYNCSQDGARKALVRNIALLVRNSLPASTGASWRWASSSYDKEELLQLFISSPMPGELITHLKKKPPRGYGVCYLGGLRFEVLRHTYAAMFAGTIT